ncbi:MAG TPA: type II secretion system minor pseudopilin GspJ [Allosphingosinicella sp.]|nr:type II secretion system minor pseudopilin GspJ [Allosphingosinicella sp.]
MKRAGFTLVEMLIALAIFGMLTAAGVALLTLTVRTQETSNRLLGEVGELRRLDALLTADLALAAPRLSRDRDGAVRPALIGGAGDGELLLALVRRGGDEGAVQRVEYRLREGRLERLAFAQVDGESRALVAPLLDGVGQVALRYRDREGAWTETWRATDRSRLPRAIELVSTTNRHGSVRQLFLVAGGG